MWYAFRHTGLQQFLYQFRVGESPWRLLKSAQYTYFMKYIGGEKLGKKNKTKQKRSIVFQRNLLPLIQKTAKVFGNFCWEHYHQLFEYIPVWNEKWICVCVCETPNLFFTCSKSEVYMTIQLFLIQQKYLCMRAFHISYKWYRALVSDFPSDSSFQPHPRTWHLTQPQQLDLGLRSWQFRNNDWNRLERLELKEMFISLI